MATSENQPNLSDEQVRDIGLIHQANDVVAGAHEDAKGALAWKEEGNAVSAMFERLGIEPVSVALFASEMIEELIAGDEEASPLSYAAGFVAGMAVGVQFEVLRERQA